MMSKWLKIGSKGVKIAQNRHKAGSMSGQSDTAKTNENCDQIPRRGTADVIDLRPLGRQGPNLGHKRGLKATPKFGMHLGVLTVFSGPVHCRGAQRESKWHTMAQNGSKQAHDDPTYAQSG